MLALNEASYFSAPVWKNRIIAKCSRETRSSAKIKNSGAIVTEAELCCVRWEVALRLGCKFQIASSFPSIMLSICVLGLVI